MYYKLAVVLIIHIPEIASLVDGDKLADFLKFILVVVQLGLEVMTDVLKY